MTALAAVLCLVGLFVGFTFGVVLMAMMNAASAGRE